MQQWYMAIGGHQVGPVSQDDVVTNLRNGTIDGNTLVFTAGMSNWTPLKDVPQLAAYLSGGSRAPGPAPPPPASTVSGYMDFHFTKPDQLPAELDFHRFVLLFAHQFSDRIRFVGELELEHAFVEGLEDAGELELEQAYVDFLLSRGFSVRAGMVLMPMGIINERHEPPVFYGVERPLVDTVILPTTWFEVGAGVFVPRAVFVFSKDHIQHPVQFVFDGPVPADRLGLRAGREATTANVVQRRGDPLAVDRSFAVDRHDHLRTRPLGGHPLRVRQRQRVLLVDPAVIGFRRTVQGDVVAFQSVGLSRREVRLARGPQRRLIAFHGQQVIAALFDDLPGDFHLRSRRVDGHECPLEMQGRQQFRDRRDLVRLRGHRLLAQHEFN